MELFRPELRTNGGDRLRGLWGQETDSHFRTGRDRCATTAINGIDTRSARRSQSMKAMVEDGGRMAFRGKERGVLGSQADANKLFAAPEAGHVC